MSLSAARQEYESAATSVARKRALQKILREGELLLASFTGGTMPAEVQAEIMYAAAVVSREGHQVQMDIAANAAAGAELDARSLLPALVAASKDIRENAIQLAADINGRRRRTK